MISGIIRELRPSHWIKNTVVLAAFFFAIGDPGQASAIKPYASSLLKIVTAAALFCVISSGIYVLNDLFDLELDRAHPWKKFRPIAAGEIPRSIAVIIAAALLCAGLLGSWGLSRHFAYIAAGYIALHVCYSLFLKHLALVDVMIIAAGFVLRALAGAVVLSVAISPWLVLCTFLLALFLGFCKRKHEKILMDDRQVENRPSLSNYDEKLLDIIIAIVTAATIVCYAMYTLSPDTKHKFGSFNLGFSIPFVIFGLFRYLDLVYRHDKGNKPERILLTDVPILVDMALFVCAILVAVLWR